LKIQAEIAAGGGRRVPGRHRRGGGARRGRGVGLVERRAARGRVVRRAAGRAAAAGVYDVRWDINADGAVTWADYNHYPDIPMGRGVLSHVGNRFGYAGYQHAPELAGAKWHVRNRVLDSITGVWNRRDPLGYVDGMSLYQYVRGMALVGVDPIGLARASCLSPALSSPPWDPNWVPPTWPWEPPFPQHPVPMPAPTEPSNLDPNPNNAEPTPVPPPVRPVDPAPPPNPFIPPNVPPFDPLGGGGNELAPCRDLYPLNSWDCFFCCENRYQGCLIHNRCYERMNEEYRRCREMGGSHEHCRTYADLDIRLSCGEGPGCNAYLHACMNACQGLTGGGTR
jgi:RHS repeat-associated protein